MLSLRMCLVLYTAENEIELAGVQEDDEAEVQQTHTGSLVDIICHKVGGIHGGNLEHKLCNGPASERQLVQDNNDLAKVQILIKQLAG